VTPFGVTPLEGARVNRAYETGWQGTTTDTSGFYEIPGLYEGAHVVLASQDGYRTETRTLSISGDLRVDFQLARR
jgi:Carboxypeptidase regulatory-like domain